MNPDIEWSTREKLAIASYVLRSDEQRWTGVGRLLRPLGEPDRPPAWFSPKFCAQQYTALLENEKAPKRKRNERSDSSESPQPLVSTEEMIVRRLTSERIDELKKQLRAERSQFRKLKQEIELIESGALDDKLDDMLLEIEQQNDLERSQNEEKQLEDLNAVSQNASTSQSSPATYEKDDAPTASNSADIEAEAESVIQEMREEMRRLTSPFMHDIAMPIDTGSAILAAADDVKVNENMDVEESKNEITLQSDESLNAKQENVEVAKDAGSIPENEDNAGKDSLEINEAISHVEIGDDNQQLEAEKIEISMAQEGQLPDQGESNEDLSPSNDPNPNLTQSTVINSKINETPKQKVSEAYEEKREYNETNIEKENVSSHGDTITQTQSEPDDDGEDSEVHSAEPTNDGDSRSSAEENAATDTSSLPKTSTVEDNDNSCGEMMEENESVYNYSMDEEAQGYQHSISLPGTPGQCSSFTCDSFPSSPALSHSSDMDPDGTATWKAWRKSIMILWKQVASHRYASLFLQPVTDDIAPNYSTTVHRCMDLSTLKKNIETGVIRTTAEFQRDLMLMFQNAIMYNNREHDVYKMTQEMQKDVMDHVSQFLATQLMVETAQPSANKSLRRSTIRRSALSEKPRQSVGVPRDTTRPSSNCAVTTRESVTERVSEARSKRVAAIEGEAKFMRKKQPSHE